MQINPYAPPVDHRAPSAVPPMVGGEPVWRENNAVCVWKVAPFFPPRCVICNDHANHRIAKTVHWHEQWVYITLLAGILIYAVAAAVLRKSTHVDYGLCDKHKTRRTLGFVVIFAGFILGLGTMFMTGPQTGWLIIVGLVIMIASAVVGALMAQTIRPTRIDDHRAWFKVGTPFLDSVSTHPFTPQAFMPPYGGGYGPPAQPGHHQDGWGPR